MKVLIIGSGGREHALAWAIAKSPRVTEIVCAPGNGGIAQVARLVPVSLSDLDGMVQVAVAEQADLTVVGPELPLSLGLVDALQLRGLKVFGPSQAAAMLESSKSFAKRFLQRHKIPTANYAVCNKLAEVEKAIEFFHAPIVVKADGLAAGKGVMICQSKRAALEAAHGLFSGKLLGTKSGVGEQQLVIEEFLLGEEVSFLCLTDGYTVKPLVPAQDHKRIGEGDTGRNGGLFDRFHSGTGDAGMDHASHCPAYGSRNGLGRRSICRSIVYRLDDDGSRTAGAGVQRSIW